VTPYQFKFGRKPRIIVGWADGKDARFHFGRLTMRAYAEGFWFVVEEDKPGYFASRDQAMNAMRHEISHALRTRREIV
jgi:hypothetical protein